MTAIAIMADRLDRELKSRGVFDVSRAECVEIVVAVLAHAANVAAQSRRPPRESAGR